MDQNFQCGLLLACTLLAHIESIPSMWPFSSSSAEAGPSNPSQSFPTAQETAQPEVPTPTRWEKTLNDEEAYQAKIYPTTEEIPSCMSLM